MLRLVFKDLFMYQRKNLFILPCYAILIVSMMNRFASGNTVFTEYVFFASVVIISLFAIIMILQTSSAYDEANKTNRFLRATPLAPFTIVASKYISCALSSVMGLIFLIIVIFIYNQMPALFAIEWIPIRISWDAIVVWAVISVVSLSVVLPVIIKFGYSKVKYPFLLCFITLVVSTPTMFEVINKNPEFLLMIVNFFNLLPFVPLLAAVAVLFLSLRLSEYIFAKQEL